MDQKSIAGTQQERSYVPICVTRGKRMWYSWASFAVLLLAGLTGFRIVWVAKLLRSRRKG